MRGSASRRHTRMATVLLIWTSGFYLLFVFALHPPEQFVFSDMLFFAQVGNRLQFDAAVAGDLLKPIGYPLLLAAVLLIPGLLALLATRDVTSQRQQQVVVAQTDKDGVGLAPVGLIGLLTLVMLLMRAR